MALRERRVAKGQVRNDRQGLKQVRACALGKGYRSESGKSETEMGQSESRPVASFVGSTIPP